MAVTFALLSADHHVVKYRVTSAGAEAGNLDAAGAATPDLITDTLFRSPLRTVVSTASAAQATSRTLMLENANMLVTLTQRDADASWILDADTTGAAIRLTATAAAADATGAILTIEHRHTKVR